MEFEDVLSEAGDFGPHQKSLIWWFLVPTTFSTALYVVNIIFMTAVPDHWCRVPDLVAAGLSLDQQKMLSIPLVAAGGEERYSKCLRYAVDYEELLRNFSLSGELPRPGDDWPTETCSDGWIYDSSLYRETAASRWDLVCDHDGLPSLVLTLANVGSVIGTFLFGVIADRHGRRIAFFVNITMAAVFGVLSVFSPTFTVFAILRMFTGATLPANFQLPYIITVEQVGPKLRSGLICLCWMLWTLGACFLALVAFLTRHWITLGLVTTLPTILFLAYWSYLPPSPRFLLTQSRYEEAAVAIEKIAIKNNREVPRDLIPKLKKICQTLDKNSGAEQHSLLDLLSYPQLRKKLLVVTLNWCAIAVAYFGLIINVTNLGGNDFLNFFLLSIVELPAFPLGWYVMDHIGRRWANTAFVLLAGISCLLPVFLPPEMEVVTVAASLVGKFGSAAAFMVIYQQAAELYPTAVRSLGMSVGSTVSSLAVICMPFVVYLGYYNKTIPFLIIGGVCIVAGLLAPLVPETLNERLPQTILSSESFGINQSFFSCGRPKAVDEGSNGSEQDVVDRMSSV